MTVHYPYPQHANMEIQDDVERVARWLGSIVKPAYFNAFYHKPSVSTVLPLVSLGFLSPFVPSWPPRLAHIPTFVRNGRRALLPSALISPRCVALVGMIGDVRY